MSWSLLDRRSYFGLSQPRLQTLYMIAAAALATLVPLILLAGFWIRSEFAKGDRDVQLWLGSRVASLSQRVDAEIERQLTAMQALAALPGAEANTPEFQDAAKRVNDAMAHWAGLALLDPETGRIAFVHGNVASEADDGALARRAVASRRPVIEALSVAHEQRGGIRIYAPFGQSGAAAGVLLLSFDAGDIQDLLTNTAGPDLVSTVIDRRGIVLAQTGNPQDAVGKPALPAIVDGASGRPSGMVNARTREGEPVSVAFVRSELTSWLSSAALARTPLLSSSSVWATVGASALSIALAGILTVFIIHTMMERRSNEERLAASRALGELDARLLATSQEALGDQQRAAGEREVLLREIYHRVKNNLQIVQSLLRLGSRELRPEQREPFENAVRRIGAMARVHTLLYNSPDLASIDFKDYLDELLKELAEGFSAEQRSIEAVLQADPMRMPLDTAVPLAFIAVEILTNSFKHAFPEGRAGRITVEVHREESHAVLTIRDDGVGLSVEPAAKQRLGLTIVRKLVQQIGGEIKEPQPGSATFVVRFPVGTGEPSLATAPTVVPATS